MLGIKLYSRNLWDAKIKERICKESITQHKDLRGLSLGLSLKNCSDFHYIFRELYNGVYLD